jgi:hypothetical protein
MERVEAASVELDSADVAADVSNADGAPALSPSIASAAHEA